MKKHWILSILLIFLSVSQSWAYRYQTEDIIFSVDGFGSLGLATSDSDKLGYLRYASQSEAVREGRLLHKTDSSLGLQFSLGNNWATAVVQVLAKDEITDDISRYFNYAYLDFKLSPNLFLRAGRMPYEIYLLSNSSSVDFAHLWIRPPTTLYNQTSKGYAEGVTLRYDHHFQQHGSLKTILFGGNLGITHYFQNDLVEYDIKPFWGGSLRYSPRPDLSINGVYMYASPSATDVLSYPPLVSAWQKIPETVIPSAREVEKFVSTESHADYFCLGALWEPGSWQIQTEIDKLDLNRYANYNILSGYLSVGYTIGEWTPYILFGYTKSNKDRLTIIPNTIDQLPEDIQKLAFKTQWLYNWTNVYQKHITIGCRWDFHQNMALKFQWDHWKVAPQKTLFWSNLAEQDFKGEGINVFSAALNFIF